MTDCFRVKKNIVQFVFCSKKSWPNASHTLPPPSPVLSLLKVQVILVILFMKRSTEQFWQVWKQQSVVQG